MSCNLSPEETLTLRNLRIKGFAVVIFTPEEVGDADSSALEDIMVERGNNFLVEENECFA